MANASPQNLTSERRAYSDRCQRCRAQLKIIDDVPPSVDVSASFRGSLADSFLIVHHRDDEASRAVLKESFIVVPDVRQEVAKSTELEEHSLPKGLPTPDQVAKVEKIIKLASGQTTQDHPVCSECMKLVVAEVQKLVDSQQAANRVYMEAHARLQEQLGLFAGEMGEALQAEISDLEAEERQLQAKLEALAREEEELEKALKEQQIIEDNLALEEESLWAAYADYQLDLETVEDDSAATASAIKYATSELNRLQKTHLLNDMFHITDQGPFGTISKFRMGRLPDHPVPWEEINAAWGQACLLLDALVRKCNIPLPCKLLPKGSFSAIQVKSEVFPLHNKDGGFTGFFTNRTYDTAMTHFLLCMDTLTKYLQRDSSVTKLPYKIEGDKVGGYSIQFMFSQPDRWTKALKFMLADLKWMVAFVESRDRTGPRGSVQR